MGLLSKLKSLLGAGDADRSAGSGVDVTVERDPSADDERAGGEPTSTADDATGTDASTATEPSAEDQPADPSEADEEPAVEEAEPDREPEAETEPAESEAESVVESDADEATDETEASPDDGVSVSDLKGIGPAYAERLEDAGVSTVAELAAADPADLAERVDLSEKRVGRWVDRANDRS